MAEIYPRLLGINLPNIDHQELVFNSNEYRIGRCLGLELCLRDVNISRLHCIFTKGETSWSIACKSSNGVRVNGNKLEKDTESPLKHGDTIRLAEQQIYYWKFVQVVDLTHNENVAKIEEKEDQPASKKMRLMEVGLESRSRHIFEAAKQGLEKVIDTRRRAAEDRLLSLNAVLEEAVSEGGKRQDSLASQKEMLLKRLEEQIRSSEKAHRDLRQEAEKRFEEEKVDQKSMEREMKEIEETIKMQSEKGEGEIKSQLEEIEIRMKLREEAMLKDRKEKEVMLERMTQERTELEETLEKEKREIEMKLKQLQERLDKENSSKERIENEFKVMVDKLKNEQDAKLNNDKENWIEMEKVIAHQKREKERLAKEVKEQKEGFEVERSNEAAEMKEERVLREADLELELAPHTAQMNTFKEKREKKEAEYQTSMTKVQQRDQYLVEENENKSKHTNKKEEISKKIKGTDSAEYHQIEILQPSNSPSTKSESIFQVTQEKKRPEMYDVKIIRPLFKPPNGYESTQDILTRVKAKVKAKEAKRISNNPFISTLDSLTSGPRENTNNKIKWDNSSPVFRKIKRRRLSTIKKVNVNSSSDAIFLLDTPQGGQNLDLAEKRRAHETPKTTIKPILRSDVRKNVTTKSSNKETTISSAKKKKITLAKMRNNEEETNGLSQFEFALRSKKRKKCGK